MILNVSRNTTLAGLAAIVVCVATWYFVDPVRDAVNSAVRIMLIADTQKAVEGFRDYVLSFGACAPAISAALMVFQSVIAPLPAFVITFANGLLFGWAWGALLSWSSAMVGAGLCFWLARALGRPVVERLVGGTKALEVSDAMVARYGSRAVLIARLLPFVSFDVISYGAGLTPMKFGSFLIATGIGQLPATLLYSYLGQNVTGSVRALFWVFSIVLALVLVSSIVGPPVMRRIRAARPAQART
jgi:uncharacterized membrane protein YdjX (TVP38/TMEM64 family)